MDSIRVSTNQGLPIRKERAERILDAAAELMLRHGYKRVTVDDVAARAGIGKGTLYLHWKTRQALFTAVLAREYVAAIDELVTILQQDPQAAGLSRLASRFYRVVMQRPLLRAIFTADLEILGELGKSGVSREVEAQENRLIGDYLKLLQEFGLVPGGSSGQEALYAFYAVMAGFFMLDPLRGAQRLQLGLEAQSDVLAATLHRAFETDLQLSPEAAGDLARRTVGLFTAYAALYRDQLYGIKDA